MSENLNCRAGSFTKYDSMSIEELEAVLRADAETPDGQESDVDEILYVMEVLAKRRRNNGIAGKTALEAYESFQQHYLLNVEDKNIEVTPKQKSRKIMWFRRLASVAAAVAIIVSLSITANAFGLGEFWNVVAKWAQETFHFSSEQFEISEPISDDNLDYGSLQNALDEIELNVEIPTWLPEGYELEDIIVEKNPKQEVLLAIYLNNEKMLKISVKSFLQGRPEQVETGHDFSEVYTVSNIDYYIFNNYNQYQAVWIVDTYECYISGELTIEEMKQIIDSIEKG